MTIIPPGAESLAAFHACRQALWESLSLLSPDEWAAPVLDGVSPQNLLTARLADDLGMARAMGAESVVISPSPSYDVLMEQAVETAQRLAARWQAMPETSRQDMAAVNDAYIVSAAEVDAYLGSFERLGKEGLNRWLLRVYNAIMDSVAGMTEAEIMGEPWHGEWNTYQLLEHVWAWNEQVLDIARHWGQTPVPHSLRLLPVVGEHNRHVGKVYDGRDMVAVADAIVTVYRKTAQLVNRADPTLLRQVDDFPWTGRGSLCCFIFEAYRHAYGHALEIRGRRGDKVTG